MRLPKHKVIERSKQKVDPKWLSLTRHFYIYIKIFLEIGKLSWELSSYCIIDVRPSQGSQFSQ